MSTETPARSSTTKPPHIPRPPTPPDAPPGNPPQQRNTAWLRQLLLRFHFYGGILAGPFILIAAITGGLYAFAPDIDRAMHRDVLTVAEHTTAVPLDDQVAAATSFIGDDAHVTSVSPGASPTDATRVVFSGGRRSETSRAVYVNPADASVTGELAVEGRGNTLAFTKWVSTLHKDLHLGDVGVIYSELAAAWLGFIAMVGVWLWAMRLRRVKKRPAKGRAKNVGRHVVVGLAVFVPILILSATGLTWSEHAGPNIREVRKELGWTGARLDTSLPGGPAAGGGEHDHSAKGGHGDHHHHGPQVSFDEALAVGRNAGLNGPQITITPAMKPGTAWTVKEVGRQAPVQRDGVAFDPKTMDVTARNEFASNPFMAKVVTWGILLHRGELFGIWSKIALLASAVAISALVVLGYVMWWQRRPTRAQGFTLGKAYPRGGLAAAPKVVSIPLVAATVGVGWFLPVFGVSLLCFVVVDVALAALKPR